MPQKKWLRFAIAGTSLLLILAMFSFGSYSVLASQPSEIVNSKINSNLKKEMKTTSENKAIPVIVMFDKKKNTNTLQKSLDSTIQSKTYKTLPMASTKLTKNEINKLAKMKEVTSIEFDEPVQAHMYKSTTWFGSHEVNKANRLNIDGSLDGDSNHYSKDDATIAIIDTGIDNNHVNLDDGKVIGWYDVINGRTTPYDDNGHGTHVAGIAAGEGSREQYKGAAPGASLVGVKVLSSSGSGSLSGVIDGIDWVITNKDTYGIDVLNMSLGSSGNGDGTDALSQAVNRAAAEGIVPVVSAGNSGSREGTLGKPAIAADAITVGAMADPSRKGFALAPFSSRGPTTDGRIKPDISGPGVGIIAPKANSGNQYVAYSGTSMSSPYVAGSAALVLSANPELSPAEVKSILMTSSHDMGPRGVDIYYGSGKVNTFGAVQLALYGEEREGLFSTSLHFGEEGLSSTGKRDIWEIDTQKLENGVPISVTLITPNWRSSNDFDLYLYNPNGDLVKSNTGNASQLNLDYQPTEKGKYKIEVRATAGSGDYLLDVSAYSYSFYLVSDDQ